MHSTELTFICEVTELATVWGRLSLAGDLMAAPETGQLPEEVVLLMECDGDFLVSSATEPMGDFS